MGTRWPHPSARVHAGAWLAFALAVVPRTSVAQEPAAAPAPAEADACFTAAERAQPLMRDKRFREARADLEMCARDVCPKVARADCREWLSEVALDQPTLVIAPREVNAERETRDVTGPVRAIIDGGIVVDRVDPTPVPLDPGKHRVRLERQGFPPLELTVDLRESEKSHVLPFYWQAHFSGPAGTGSSEGGAAGGTDADPNAGTEHRSRPTSPAIYVLGGLGLAATGVGAFLEVTGLGKRTSLESCKPRCAQGDVDTALNTTRAGDITLGVGLALVGAAAILYATRPSEPRAATHKEVDWLVGPLPGGMMAGLRGSL
ncbi:MAG: hypothetical protein ACRENE_01705 [Polyangiaceae bacterium]